jgi:hypothetical protein
MKKLLKRCATKKWLMVLILFVGLSLAICVKVEHAKAANACVPGGPYGTNYDCGYFTNMLTTSRDFAFVQSGAADWLGVTPNWDPDTGGGVTEATFISSYHTRLFDDLQTDGGLIDAGRAAAEVDIMLGKDQNAFLNAQDSALPATNPNSSIQQGIAYAQKNWNTWVSDVEYFDSAAGNAAGYSVDWNEDVNYAPILANPAMDSDGYGVRFGSPDSSEDACESLTDCEPDIAIWNNFSPNAADAVDWSVVFTMPGGHHFYINDKCANLTADDGANLVVPAAAPYHLAPSITTTVSSGAPVAEPGDTITFTYAVDNTGTGASDPATCSLYSETFLNSYHATPGGPTYDTGGTKTNPCTNQVFPASTNTKLGSPETVTLTAANLNSTICRTLSVTPVSAGTGTATTEACIPVAAQPYAKVFGGDVSAGNAQAAATCSPANDYAAGIVGWNTGSGLYTGAGSQFAALAIGDIAYFASSQTNTTASSATAPSGLSFANTITNNGSGIYGGSLGSGSLPCMNDYYNVLPGATSISSNTASPDTINLTTLASGTYVYNGTGELTLSGTLGSGATPSRIQLFVPNQNVYISNAITYQGNWQSISQIPMFELVVNDANILISNTAGEVDGTYVAQNSQANGKGTGGQIATCATPAAAITPSASLYSSCNNSLTVNGAFVANDVVLERSTGTLSSSTGDTPTTLSSSAAEQFNYNPSLWLVQPPHPPRCPDLQYDCGSTAGVVGTGEFAKIFSFTPS